MRLRYTILFVSDLERSRHFYHKLLQIPIRSEDPSSVEFDTGDATLALHRSHVGESHHHPPMAAGSARIGLYVDDLDAIHAHLMEARVPCITQPEERFDLRVGLYEDPDGNYFTLAEAATDATRARTRA